MSEPPRFPGIRHRHWWSFARRAPAPALLLDDTLTALGTSQACGPGHTRAQTVAVRNVVGTLARFGDFDRNLRPMRRDLRDRWERVAGLSTSGADLPPVSLVRVGEVYFVADGHHRLSVAAARGQLAVDALVRTVCTLAFACACLTVEHLPLKAAERDFLTAVPLPDPALRDLWLDDPADYQHLHAAAHDWSAHHSDTSNHCCLAPDTAATWWQDHVLPLAHAHRAAAPSTAAPSTAAAYLRALKDHS